MGIRSLVFIGALSSLAFGAFAVGCSGKPKCDASSCMGCCVDANTCANGDIKAQCGGNGVACQACAGDSICFMHACTGGNGGGDGGSDAGTDGGIDGGTDAGIQLPCEGTCNGCCLGGLCYTGNSNTDCGSGGNACVGCPSSQSCATNACVDSTCNGCVTGTTCHTAPNDSHCGTAGATCYDCTSFGATCNVATGACTGGTCAGCLDATGHCQSGTIKGYCGLGGGACLACAAGQGCTDAGVCITIGSGMMLPGQICATATAAPVGMTVMGTTNGYDNDTMGSCAGTGPDHVYTLTLPVAVSVLGINVAPMSSGFAPVAYLRGSCDGNELACNAASNGGSSAQINYPDAGAGAYFIYVDGSNGTSGDFLLSVNTL